MTGWRASLIPLVPAALVGGLVLITVNFETRLGRETQAAMTRETRRLADPVVVGYVREIGAELARHAGGPKFPYSFDVADVRTINAFALPGGPVWVHRGALAAARSEAEVAGILAHEIAHIAERHSAEQISTRIVTSLGLTLFSALLGNDLGAATAQMAAQALAGGVLLKFSRDDEREADAAGAAMMRKAGWDPRGLIGFLEVLRSTARRDPSSVAVFFSTHPAPEDRIAALAGLARPAAGEARDSGRFARMAARLRPTR